MTNPVTVLAPSKPNIIGVVRAPELVALMPSTPWKTSGVNRIGDEATTGGAGERARSEHGAEQAGETSALVRREELADDGEHRREEDAAEDALPPTSDEQLGHVLRQPAQG